jgi:hypothetical protein
VVASSVTVTVVVVAGGVVIVGHVRLPRHFSEEAFSD